MLVARSLLLALALLAPLAALAASPWPALDTVARGTERVGSKDAALVIAIEDYTYAPAVSGAVDNARDWVGWLSHGRGVPVVRPLLDEQAYREQVLQSARDTADRVRPGGRLWIIFIGHGAPARTGTDGVLVGVDAQQSALSLEARSVSRQELLDAVADGKQSETVLVLDACFSGRTSGGQLVPGLQPLKPVAARIASGHTTILTAAGADEYTGPLPGAARPAFSYLVLGALRGWGDRDGDGAVTADEAVRFAGDALFQTVTDRRQTPSLDGEDLVLGHGREGPPDLLAVTMGDGWQPPLADQDIADFTLTASTSEPPPGSSEAVAELLVRDDLSPPIAARASDDYPSVRVSAGRFTMGSPKQEAGRYRDEDPHPVELSHALQVGHAEVTVALWDEVRRAQPFDRSDASCVIRSTAPRTSSDLPVTCVTWTEALAFANALSRLEGLEPCYDQSRPEAQWPGGADCRGWRLPTEAEWEYLARAGGEGPFAGSSQPASVAWYAANSDGRSRSVAGLRPNAWGLYDLSGNVWEWVWESPERYPDRPVRDPQGDATGPLRIVRGGSWTSAERDLRAAARGRALASEASDDVGFRLVRTVD